jgi:hypothetical protein
MVQTTRSLCSLSIRLRNRAKRRVNHAAPSALQTDLPVAVEERPVAPPAGPSADVAVHVSPLCGAGARLTDRVAIHLQRGAQQGAYGELFPGSATRAAGPPRRPRVPSSGRPLSFRQSPCHGGGETPRLLVLFLGRRRAGQERSIGVTPP